MGWQRRHSILVALSAGYLISYLDRMVMASAIPFIAEDFHLSPLAMGGVLSAFFLGYALMQLPGGLLVDRFGPGSVMLVSMLGWSVFTFITGLAESLTALLIVRVLFGLTEGPFPSAAAKATRVWFPPQQIGRANGLQLAALKIGAAIAPLLVAPLILHFGWRMVFYSLLVPGLVLALLIRVLTHETPAASQAEPSQRGAQAAAMGLLHLLRRPEILWCAVTLFFVNLASWGLMNWLPTYLLRARGFSVTEMGWGASLPLSAGALGYYLGGHVSDRYFNRRRHIPIIGGLITGGAMTYGAVTTASGGGAVAALVLAFLFLFVASAGLFTLPLLIEPEEAVGTAYGLINTVAQLAALLSPLLVGAVLKLTHSNFTLVFQGFVALYLIGAAAAFGLRRKLDTKVA